jgi:hypothetical protein
MVGVSPPIGKFQQHFLPTNAPTLLRTPVEQNQRENFRAFCLPMNLRWFQTLPCNRARLQPCRKVLEKRAFNP